MSLERYRSIVPDFSRFLEVASTPEPPSLRVRAGRISHAALRRRLERSGFLLEPVPGLEDFLRPAEPPPGPLALTMEHWAGLFYLQQAVMGLPVLALDAQPGHQVLDLCAAPGGKTTHLAERLRGKGSVIASDVKEKRVRILMGNVKRLGLTGVMAMTADGAHFPGGALYDRVLVDAPCSGEGTVRSKGGRLPRASAGFRSSVTELQERLLRTAIRRTRVGGRVVYSTCTFAPEENEAVVDRVLRDLPVEVEEIPVEVPHAPGLRSFEGQRFSPELEKAWRVYPHQPRQLDSGGLFMVRLRRIEEGAASDPEPDLWEPAPTVYSDPSRKDTPGAGTRAQASAQDGTDREGVEEAVDELSRRFSLAPGALEGVRWLRRGRNVWAHHLESWPLGAWPQDGNWRFLSLGLRGLQREGRGRHRVTNDLLGLLGDDIGARTIAVDAAELSTLLRGESVGSSGMGGGYIALTHEGLVLGRGLVRNGRIHSQIPKERARELARIMEARGKLTSPGGR